MDHRAVYRAMLLLMAEQKVWRNEDIAQKENGCMENEEKKTNFVNQWANTVKIVDDTVLRMKLKNRINEIDR